MLVREYLILFWHYTIFFFLPSFLFLFFFLQRLVRDPVACRQWLACVREIDNFFPTFRHSCWQHAPLFPGFNNYEPVRGLRIKCKINAKTDKSICWWWSHLINKVVHLYPWIVNFHSWNNRSAIISIFNGVIIYYNK